MGKLLINCVMSYINLMGMIVIAIQLSGGAKKIDNKKLCIVGILTIPFAVLTAVKEHINWYPLIVEFGVLIVIIVYCMGVCYKLSKAIKPSIIASFIGIGIAGFVLDIVLFIVLGLVYGSVQEAMNQQGARFIGTCILTMIMLGITYILYKKDICIKPKIKKAKE